MKQNKQTKNSTVIDMLKIMEKEFGNFQHCGSQGSVMPWSLFKRKLAVRDVVSRQPLAATLRIFYRVYTKAMFSPGTSQSMTDHARCTGQTFLLHRRLFCRQSFLWYSHQPDWDSQSYTILCGSFYSSLLMILD